MKDININQIYTFKLASGEELVAKVVAVDYNTNTLELNEPVSVAPGPQGMGLIPSLFTADHARSITLNTNSVLMWAETEPQVVSKYRQATTGIVAPEKRVILG